MITKVIINFVTIIIEEIFLNKFEIFWSIKKKLNTIEWNQSVCPRWVSGFSALLQHGVLKNKRLKRSGMILVW